MKLPEFVAPNSVKEARQRMQEIELDIRGIERQLSDKVRTDRQGRRLVGDALSEWRSKAQTSWFFKKAEYARLKSWVLERRRKVSAEEIGIWDPDDAREILNRARVLIREALDNQDVARLGLLYNVIIEYLLHAA